MAAKIFTAARDRLLEIWDYTERTWGEEQADNYVRGIVDAATRVQRERFRWRSVGDATLSGVFFFRYEHHYIFFRELSDGTLGVISILHENMDIPSRLKEDAERGQDE
jgi:plasmid stabilization system protein ParE